MASKVVVSDRVAFKIEETVHYLENACNNRRYATQFYKAVEESILGLETKEGFHIRDQEVSALIHQDIYRIKLDKYKLLYTVNTNEGIVVVFSFFHESQDFKTIILSDFANVN